mgnify:FL=1
MLETAFDQGHVSIDGGKLTDCLNVGDEICDRVSELGVRLNKFKPSSQQNKWYGEPAESIRVAYFTRAKSLGLDEIKAVDTDEILSQRLWRRYAAHADSILDAIEKDTSLCDSLIENAGIRRCELEHLAQSELITKLEDFLRRRSKIELLFSQQELKQSKGLFEACEKLFGEDAQARFDEYFMINNP